MSRRNSIFILPTSSACGVADTARGGISSLPPKVTRVVLVGNRLLRRRFGRAVLFSADRRGQNSGCSYTAQSFYTTEVGRIHYNVRFDLKNGPTTDISARRLRAKKRSGTRSRH
jgi:hypothetical protein